MIDYYNKMILAPMVRINSLPTRLMALKYGADIVYTEEIVDKKLVTCTRVENAALGTIDYVEPKQGAIVVRIHPSEQSRLVCQLGTADPELALQAAKKIWNDVAAIDVNCGCPKRFSIQGGMGAALLNDQERLKKILTNLVVHCPKPVTCKIRIFPDIQKTVELCKMIESTGVHALAVHCRYIEQRPREPGHWSIFKHIVDAVSIPVIANGVASVMIARGAQENLSVFRKEGPLDKTELAKEFLALSLNFGNAFANSKYILHQMFEGESKTHKQISRAKNFADLSCIFVDDKEKLDSEKEVLVENEE